LSTTIDLASYFDDEQKDPLKMTASYRYNDKNSKMIPEGIFTKLSGLQIDVVSTSI
jgi:hypothetical protein